jgi:hypothetical protein
VRPSCGVLSARSSRSSHANDSRKSARPPNNAMQLTKGGWMHVGASSPARRIVDGGEVVRPSQLIASVRWTSPGWEEPVESNRQEAT